MTNENQKIIDLLMPVAEEEKLELVDAEVTTDGGQKVLRIYIDQAAGVKLEDCSRFSRAIEDLIEVEGVVKGAYRLEVSSPGLNRPLKTKAHFEKVVGQEVNVTTRDKINGRKRYKGILQEVKADELVIFIDNQEFTVPLQELAKANLVTI